MGIIPVIMAGGAGTRLWPLSREGKPKQFHNLSGNGTLMEETINRLSPLQPENIVIVTSDQYRDISREELKKCGLEGTVLCEPRPRNTAAAILYAALFLEKSYPESAMIVCPADHYIRAKDVFARVIKTAVDEADSDSLVTIGITPDYPETGYGYIRSEETSGEVRAVSAFVEKPDAGTAREYVKAGNYFWNSGIFIWKTKTILGAFEEHMPEMWDSFRPLRELSPKSISCDDTDAWEIKKRIFDEIASVSVDYGILEKAKNRVVVPADFGWADLGSWKAIDDILDPDENGNRAPEPGKAIFYNSRDCSTFSEERRISVVGLSNIVVVEAGNEILVIDKDSSQDVRSIVDIIRKGG